MTWRGRRRSARRSWGRARGHPEQRDLDRPVFLGNLRHSARRCRPVRCPDFIRVFAGGRVGCSNLQAGFHAISGRIHWRFGVVFGMVLFSVPLGNERFP